MKPLTAEYGRYPRHNHVCQCIGDDRLRGFWVAGVKFPLPRRLSSSPLQHSRTTVRMCDSRAKICAARMLHSSIGYRSLSADGSKPAGSRRCCCRSTGQTDRRTDGRTLDRFMAFTAYCADRVTDCSSDVSLANSMAAH